MCILINVTGLNINGSDDDQGMTMVNTKKL